MSKRQKRSRNGQGRWTDRLDEALEKRGVKSAPLDPFLRAKGLPERLLKRQEQEDREIEESSDPE